MPGTRRDILAAIAALPAATLATRRAAAQAPLPPTPQCAGAHEPTPAQIAGPFYKPDSPLRSNLREDAGDGVPFDLHGRVLDTACQPLEGAIVELWHADPHGAYDNRGFRLRGHQVTGPDGRWAFATLLTRHYARRTAHYHFRVHSPATHALVTQLYFPGHPRNATDSMFNEHLMMTEGGTAQHRTGRFDFVLARAAGGQ